VLGKFRITVQRKMRFCFDGNENVIYQVMIRKPLATIYKNDHCLQFKSNVRHLGGWIAFSENVILRDKSILSTSTCIYQQIFMFYVLCSV
jgi:hypothetical protein